MDVLPGYVDQDYQQPDTLQGTNNAGTDANPGKVIRLAWLIIMLCLIGLWVMGALVFKRGS